MSQELTRKPLCQPLGMSLELATVTSKMLESDGLCSCGRYLSKLDAKFILANPIPSRGVVIVAAYCFSCAEIINSALSRCINQAYKEKRSEAELRG